MTPAVKANLRTAEAIWLIQTDVFGKPGTLMVKERTMKRRVIHKGEMREIIVKQSAAIHRLEVQFTNRD